MPRTSLALSALLCLSSPGFAAGVADRIDVESPTARAVPHASPNSAGYLTLVNRDSSPHQVVAAHSDIASSTELHEHAHENGVMKMRRIGAIDLPAGASVKLQPGGLHVMFIGLTGAVNRGDRVAIELEYEDGSRDAVTLIAE